MPGLVDESGNAILDNNDVQIEGGNPPVVDATGRISDGTFGYTPGYTSILLE